MKIFTIIDYALKTKQGYEAPDELMGETSFAFIEGFFILSFVILGILSLSLLFIAFFYNSYLALFFGFLFIMVLSVDIWIFKKVKKFVMSTSKKVVDEIKKMAK